MDWILQDKNYALGNFINITPVIKWMYEKTNAFVPVYFETEYVKDCYKNSPYILHLNEKPNTEPIASSSMINRKNDLPDYQYAFKLVTGIDYTDKYKPFIDQLEYEYSHFNYALIMNGSGNNNDKYVSLKNPDIEIYEKILKEIQSKGIHIVFTGNTDDFNRMKPLKQYFNNIYLNDIRTSLGLVRHANFIVTNDTGLCHAAGCFDKKQFVLWKDTKFIKNQNSGNNTMYAHKHEWMEKFNQFIKD